MSISPTTVTIVIVTLVVVACIAGTAWFACSVWWFYFPDQPEAHQIECPMCGESEATQNEWTSWIEDLDGWRMARKCCACSHRWRWE